MKAMLIASVGTGTLGGHHRSFISILNSLSKHIDCIGINVGRKYSSSHKLSRTLFHNIIYTKFSLIQPLLKLKKIFHSFKPDIVHSFDIRSLLFSRLISLVYTVPIIHTKCGGPNPKGYFW